MSSVCAGLHLDGHRKACLLLPGHVDITKAAGAKLAAYLKVLKAPIFLWDAGGSIVLLTLHHGVCLEQAVKIR